MKRFLPHVVAFLVVAIWGTTFVFTKLLLLGGLTAAQIFILRFIIAYILLLSYCLARGIRWLADSWRDELLMVALGVTGGSLYFLTENSSMNYTTTTNTSIIVSLLLIVKCLLMRNKRLSPINRESYFLNILLMLCRYSVGVIPKANLKALLNAAELLNPHLLTISSIEQSECSISIFAAYSARKESI